MSKVTDVTDEELAKTSGPGEYVKRVRSAKAAKQITPSLQETLDQWNRRSDKTIGFISNPLAYGFRFIKPREHSNLIRLLKSKKLRLCRVDGNPPTGSNAEKDSRYADRYFILRESCPSEVADGALTGRRQKRR